MNKIATAFVSGWLALAFLSGSGHAASTINTSVPAPNAPLQSAPIRNNFLAAASDFNAMLGMFATNNCPGITSPTVGQFCLNIGPQPNLQNIWDGAQWILYGTLDPVGHTFTGAAGNPLLMWQQIMPGGFGSAGQCITMNGAAALPTPQNCVSASTLVATAPLAWNAGTLTVSINLNSDFTVSGGNLALAAAQPAAHTWSGVQTFTLAPVFTNQSGTRTALGLGTAATQNTGTSGATLPFLNGANTWSGVNVYNLNSASVPSALTGTAIQIVGTDATAARIEVDAFGTASPAFFTSRAALGTAASPTALTANTQIGGYNSYGYNGSAWVGPSATFRCFASETWTTAPHQGTYCEVATTLTGSATLASVMRWENDGGVTVPSTVTGGSKGAGTLNVAGLYDTGNRVLTLASAIALSQLAPQADQTVVGNVSGGLAAPIALTKTQLTTLINTFTTSLTGAVPAPGSVSGKVLSDNGTWITVGGTGTVTSVQIANGTGISVSGTCTITGSGVCTVALSTPVSAANGGTGVSNSNTITLAGNVVTAGALTTAGAFALTLTATNTTNATFPAGTHTLAALDLASQVLTGGFLMTSLQLSSGSVTPNCGSLGLQWIINTGSFTITAPTPSGNVGYCNLRIINGPSAGTPTLPTGSGQVTSWSVGSNTGDAFATTLKHTASCTATNASPAVFTDTAHGLPNGWPVYLTGTTAPTGFTLNVVYFTDSVATNTYRLAATPGGTAINSSSTGTSITCNASSQYTLVMEQNIGGSTYAYKALQFLLRRDLGEPGHDNDNTPAFLNQAA